MTVSDILQDHYDKQTTFDLLSQYLGGPGAEWGPGIEDQARAMIKIILKRRFERLDTLFMTAS